MLYMHRWLSHVLCVCISFSGHMFTYNYTDCYIMLYVYRWSSSDTLCEQISGPMYIDLCLFVLSVKMVISFQCVQMVISCHMHIDGYLMPYAYRWLSHAICLQLVISSLCVKMFISSLCVHIYGLL